MVHFDIQSGVVVGTSRSKFGLNNLMKLEWRRKPDYCKSSMNRQEESLFKETGIVSKAAKITVMNDIFYMYTVIDVSGILSRMSKWQHITFCQMFIFTSSYGRMNRE